MPQHLLATSSLHTRGEMITRTWWVYAGTERETDRHIFKVESDDRNQVISIAEKQAIDEGYIITHESRIMDIIFVAAVGD